MGFLSPWVIAIAAGLTVPPLVALYFLKLKRDVRVVPSTLLWKKAIEDLRVNAPFQRLRSSLLLLLQLLVLLLAALALGKPMWEQAARQEDNVIILVDQSASMGVIEQGGETRLDVAKREAAKCVDNMSPNARAMVIAFCDQATVVSSFDTDRDALKRKIESIEQTESSTGMAEAVNLAEAFAQQVTVGIEEFQGHEAPPTTVFVFTDGRIADTEHVSLREFDIGKLIVSSIGARSDNAGILALEARRNYETPEMLQVAATVRNFSPEPMTFDAVLYIDGTTVDVQSVVLQPGVWPDEPEGDNGGGGSASGDPAASPGPPPGSEAVCAFDEIEFGGGGVVEVTLRTDDALHADNNAWTIVQQPRDVSVLLVTPGNLFLSRVLAPMPIQLTTMSPGAYESAPDEDLLDGDRSKFDVVMIDGHSTARLPQGNYMFWGGVPEIEGVSAGRTIDDEVIFNWDDTHPLLRYVATEDITVYEWLELRLPPEARSIIDGRTSPVLSLLNRDASQYLICAFGLTTQDAVGQVYSNTNWPVQVDFVVFIQNAIQFLAANLATEQSATLRPGDPVTLPAPEGVTQAKIIRPDNVEDAVVSGGFQSIHYARTRHVGPYRMEPGVPGRDQFAVNLFNAEESRVEPAASIEIGATTVEAKTERIDVNQPAWPYFLIALLVFLVLEWIIYNLRVFV